MLPHSFRRCYGVTSWQPCLSTRAHKPWQQKARHQHATAASTDQAISTAEAPKAKPQQQPRKQSNQKGGKNGGGKADKKSELAVTPKSEDFARYCILVKAHHNSATTQHACNGRSVLAVGIANAAA